MTIQRTDQSLICFITHAARKGATHLLEAGKVPAVRKIPALLRLHGLNRAIVALEEDAFAVWFFLQRQSAAVVAQPHEALNEVVLAQTLERGEPGDFRFRHAHLPGPATAGGATLAFVEDRHNTDATRRDDAYAR